MTLSAILVALYALSLLALPGIRPPFIKNLFASSPGMTSVHFMGGAIAIVAGAFQFSPWLRARHGSWHRWLGRSYVAAIAFSGVAGFALALNSVGGRHVQTGFGLMAIFWLVSTAQAYRQIRNGHVKAHQSWMIRSYALTLAGVTLRLYLGISIAAGIQFSAAYPVLAWICWVPNLLMAELFLRCKTSTGWMQPALQTPSSMD